MRRLLDNDRAWQREQSAHGLTGISYIRAHYHVPATRGGRVRYEGRLGTITGTTAGKLIVRPDVRRYHTYRDICHPTWHMEYLDLDGRVMWVDQRLAAWKGQTA